MGRKITYELIAKYFTGNCSDAEKLEIENWRNTDAESLKAFNQYRSIWENAKSPDAIFTPDVDKALQKVNRNLIVSDKPSQKRGMSSFITYASRIAAAVLVGVGIWLAFTLISRKQGISDMEIAKSDTAKMELTLADGTHIWLNKNTLVRYPVKFEGIERKIFVEGEAYFDVAKNAQMPFVIETEFTQIKVLGTEFNLKARKHESVTEIVVTEGKVAFNYKNAQAHTPLQLTAGDKGVINNQNQAIEKVKNQSPNFLSWKTGVLVFNNTPLREVALDLSSCFDITIEISNYDKSLIPLTSVFENKSLEDILVILEKSTGIKARKNGQKVILE